MPADWKLMWMLAIGIYAGCKSLTWIHAPVRNVPAWKRMAYLFAWPGLDAASFLEKHPRNRCGSAEWATAAARLVFGAALLFGVARKFPPRRPYLMGWVGMSGIVLMLHFGVFHLLSCFWRSIGVDARPLMNHPFASASLGEFWGRRWNTAFRDFAHRFLFRPLTARFGSRCGLLAGFLFSGTVHDFVISIPAQGGYGGPTIYFTAQVFAIVLQRSAFGRRIGLGSGWAARAFTAVVLIAPLPLLFHKPFVTRVILPFMRAIGALS